MIKAVYPGSFDPVTYGHLDIIKRASKVVDEVIVAILKNNSKNPLFTLEERVRMLEDTTEEFPNVKIQTFDGLTVDFARSVEAKVMIRGLRAVSDFESEMQIAQTNHSLDPDIDTMFFTTSLEYAFLSSTIVREVASYGSDVSNMVPAAVEKMLRKKYAR
ncbi:MAG: pantetheine-phosphate adenylyltransferase [Eubacterium sp.]|nr:pantetheine-phosphate adenylyltransferase [Eubacterium sp.]